MHKKIIGLAASVLTALLFAAAAAAQTYPTKTVRIIVPYQAGQGTDVMARYFAERLSKALGQTFYIDNKPGAGGNIGTEAGARATPDGYSLTMGTNGTHSMNEFLYPSTGFDPEKDFAPIIPIGMSLWGFLVSSAVELTASKPIKLKNTIETVRQKQLITKSVCR